MFQHSDLVIFRKTQKQLRKSKAFYALHTGATLQYAKHKRNCNMATFAVKRDSSYYTDKDKVVSITYEEIGLFPRSFSRVLDRFLKQLFSDVDNLVIQEYRFYRYLFLTTIKTIFILFFVPFVVNFAAKHYIVKPITEYFWNTSHPEIFLNSYEQKRAFAELENFEEKIYFETLVESHILPISSSFPSGMEPALPGKLISEGSFSYPTSEIWKFEGLINSTPLKPVETKAGFLFIKPFDGHFSNLQLTTTLPLNINKSAVEIDLKTPPEQLELTQSINGLVKQEQPLFPSGIEQTELLSNNLIPKSAVNIKPLISSNLQAKLDTSPEVAPQPYAPSEARNACLGNKQAMLHQSDITCVMSRSKLDLAKIYQEKTIELATYYNNHSIEAITNFFADLLSLCTLLYLLITLSIQINITKSFLLEVFFGLDDSKKSLLILLITDLLVGYHSSNLWELFFEFIFNHYGIPESQTGIFLLVATLPVLLDVLFKYLIFRHLNRSSPATVATYQAIIE